MGAKEHGTECVAQLALRQRVTGFEVVQLDCIEVAPGGEGLYGKRNLFVMHFQQGDQTLIR
jgi:hypothetical protein